MTARLVRELFLRFLGNPALERLETPRCSPSTHPARLHHRRLRRRSPVLRGGDIGKLAVCGTVNDLLVVGARPVALRPPHPRGGAAPLRPGADRGLDGRDGQGRTGPGAGRRHQGGPPRQGDGCFITTAVWAPLLEGVHLGARPRRPGRPRSGSGHRPVSTAPRSSPRAQHRPQKPIVSDCAPLGHAILPVLERPDGLHAMRDPTRGGLATVLCEIAEASRWGSGSTRAASPSPIRCVPPASCWAWTRCTSPARAGSCSARRPRPRARPRRATRAGSWRRSDRRGPRRETRVVARTAIGGKRLVSMLASDPLPRIC